MAREILTVRLGRDERAALAAVAALEGRDVSEALRRLLASGLRSLMARDALAISPGYLERLTDPEAVAGLALQWLDGRARGAGLVGPLGGRFRLVQGPDGHLPEPVPASDVWPSGDALAALLAGLRSPELRTRLDSGKALLDRVEAHTGPAVHKLILDAIGGDLGAVERIEAAALAAGE